KDVKALAYMASEADCHPQMLHAVMEINQDQRRRFVHRLQSMIGDPLDKIVAIWGLAFKQDTDDIRESPSLDVVRMLVQRGATVRAYDPAANDNAQAIIPEAEYVEDPYEAVRGADALCVLTPWNEFKQADLTRVVELMREPVLLDGRNLYDPSEARGLGFNYAGVGR
ncbi:MAG TPA: UDP binding domain-containing protein, partial [Thermomicrobiaceae bacterium]|nr:UDP binding domain-containing protein [Thermomicrobiaceae bacterium]